MEKSDESRTRRDEQRRKHSKMDKRAKDKLVRSPGENGGGQDAQKDLHSRTGREEEKGKTQEKMERGSRKRSSSAGSEKMERVGGRQELMEGHCSTGQSPKRAVVPMEEEERIYIYIYIQAYRFGGSDNLRRKDNTDPVILDRSEWKFMEENCGVRNLVDYKFITI